MFKIQAANTSPSTSLAMKIDSYLACAAALRIPRQPYTLILIPHTPMLEHRTKSVGSVFFEWLWIQGEE
jgi:hypothetical protein